MSLPHVLLGFLNEEPRTGYDLARALRDELDPIWSAGFSRIYPTLALLRRRGWVRLRVLGPRRGPRRHLYRATAAGRRELRRWLAEPPAIDRGNDALLARVAFLDALPAADRRRALADVDAALSREAARLRALPLPSGFLGVARRAAIDAPESLRRFLKTSGSPPAPPAARRLPGKKR
jgi:DNA-binding PadR family transcriptional regulator